MNIRLGRRTLMLGTVTTLVVGAIALAVLGAGGIVAWEYSNSNAFCTNMCHAVHPEEPVAHAASFHARVNCVECHMGRLSTLQLMAIKPTHINELWGMIVGYERPVITHSLRPARESCEACHWPEARHDDTIRVKYRYGSDPKSTEGRTTLQMHTGAGPALASGDKDITPQLRPGGAVAKGIHWHIAQDVEYVALDPQKQKIALVEVRGRRRQGEGDLLRRHGRKIPRRGGQDGKAADGLHRLPQRVGPSVHESGETGRRRVGGRAHRPRASRRSRRARTRSSRSPPASAARTRSARRSSRRSSPRKRRRTFPRRRRTPRRSSPTRCSRS